MREERIMAIKGCIQLHKSENNKARNTHSSEKPEQIPIKIGAPFFFDHLIRGSVNRLWGKRVKLKFVKNKTNKEKISAKEIPYITFKSKC